MIGKFFKSKEKRGVIANFTTNYTTTTFNLLRMSFTWPINFFKSLYSTVRTSFSDLGVWFKKLPSMLKDIKGTNVKLLSHYLDNGYTTDLIFRSKWLLLFAKDEGFIKELKYYLGVGYFLSQDWFKAKECLIASGRSGDEVSSCLALISGDYSAVRSERFLLKILLPHHLFYTIENGAEIYARIIKLGINSNFTVLELDPPVDCLLGRQLCLTRSLEGVKIDACISDERACDKFLSTLRGQFAFSKYKGISDLYSYAVNTELLGYLELDDNAERAYDTIIISLPVCAASCAPGWILSSVAKKFSFKKLVLMHYLYEGDDGFDFHNLAFRHSISYVTSNTPSTLVHEEESIVEGVRIVVFSKRG